MCPVVTLLGFYGYFVHELSKLFLARLLINVYETIVIHSDKTFASAKVLLFFDICKKICTFDADSLIYTISDSFLLILYALETIYNFDLDIFKGVDYLHFDILEVLNNFDFSAGIFKRINNFDVRVLKTVHDLNFDILERIDNLHFAVQFVGLTIFGNRTVVFVNFDIRSDRTNRKGHADKEGK